MAIISLNQLLTIIEAGGNRSTFNYTLKYFKRPSIRRTFFLFNFGDFKNIDLPTKFIFQAVDVNCRNVSLNLI